MKIQMSRSCLVGIGLCCVLFTSCATLFTRPSLVSSANRLAEFPTSGLPLSSSVDVYWNEHHVPFIDAKTDADAAFVLGMVHAHLRLGQMMVLRRLSEARLSESAGSFAVGVDHALRILNPGKRVEEIEATLPEATRMWLENFARGINYYQDGLKEIPVEARALRIPLEPFSVASLLRIGRIAGIDITWMFYSTFLRLRDTKGWEEALRLAIEQGQGSAVSVSNSKSTSLQSWLGAVSKTGSNTLVVSGKKTATRGALIANDPHLGIFAPNIWILAGIRSPSLHAVGMMIPGLPFFGVGRNKDIAWGGTNMRAISTHLYRLTPDDLTGAVTREETIRVRLGRDRKIKIRETKWGPIISDAGLFGKSNEAIALRWVGHEISDEVGAFMAAARARDFKEFRAAFRSYGVSAQNMLYADRLGNIGHVLAYGQPILAEPQKTLDLLKSSDNPVVGFRNATELPFAFNPSEGFIASANNQPMKTEPPIGFSYSTDDRIQRLKQLASGQDVIGVEDLKRWQLDTFSIGSKSVRDLLVAKLGDSTVAWSEDERRVWSRFLEFDGTYQAMRPAPVVFESLMRFVLEDLVEKRWAEPKLRDHYLTAEKWKRAALLLIEENDVETLSNTVRKHLKKTSSVAKRFPTWGDMHVQRLQHPLGNAPLIGSRYRVLEYPADGSNETLMKSAHAFAAEKVFVTYGACARHVSDLSDPNANDFVLLGGQDGWLMSPQLSDQVDLWRQGRYIRIPLDVEQVASAFTTKMSLN